MQKIKTRNQHDLKFTVGGKLSAVRSVQERSECGKRPPEKVSVLILTLKDQSAISALIRGCVCTCPRAHTHTQCDLSTSESTESEPQEKPEEPSQPRY